MTGLTIDADLVRAYSILVREADLFHCNGLLASDPSLHLNDGP